MGRQVINIFLPINHTGVELAYLKRRTVVDSLAPTGALMGLEGPYVAESFSATVTVSF